MTKDLFNPYESDVLLPAQRPHWAAKRRVADSLRKLTDALYSSAAEAAELERIAAQVEDMTRDLEAQPQQLGRLAFCATGDFGEYGELFHETSPISGQSNPLAAPLQMWLDQDKREAYGSIELGWAYEGPPAHVHGGFVAAIFDDFMGTAQSLADNAGMTGTLTIRYRRPTPLNTPLTLKAWLGHSEGRKTVVHASMHAGELLTAECEALFIRPRESIAGF